jgi:hypothetical protein
LKNYTIAPRAGPGKEREREREETGRRLPGLEKEKRDESGTYALRSFKILS